MYSKKCIIISFLALFLFQCIPIKKPPKPTGIFNVGTQSFELTDTNRLEWFTKDDPDDLRKIMVQAWYPTSDNKGEKENYIDIGTKNWKYRFYNKALNVYDDDDLKECCLNYITGLKWTFDYYFRGCKCWKWKYNYRHAPTLTDILSVMNSSNQDISNLFMFQLKSHKGTIIQL